MKALWLVLLLAIPACREEAAEAPAPMAMTADALSFYCQMSIAEHGGPKGQVHLSGQATPLFFAQVRDMVAYLKSPEREAEITAIYVSDMGAAPSWRFPGDDNWIDAQSARFVVDAGVAGGMGAPEIVPFADERAADAFVGRYGGAVVTLDTIPDGAALDPIDLDAKLEDPV
ncbi:MAG: nitrous oxide reductase accessory protein NosL [Rhodobacteraceae bacterium]|nr:nitrous oxide reductase accessory protein NosL [Paracoccaceae bacterium]